MHGNKYNAIAVSAILCALFVLPVYGGWEYEEKSIPEVTVRESQMEAICKPKNVLCMTRAAYDPDWLKVTPQMIDYSSTNYIPDPSQFGVPDECAFQWKMLYTSTNYHSKWVNRQNLTKCMMDWNEKQMLKAFGHLVGEGLVALGITCGEQEMGIIVKEAIKITGSAVSGGACAVIAARTRSKKPKNPNPNNGGNPNNVPVKINPVPTPSDGVFKVNTFAIACAGITYAVTEGALIGMGCVKQ